MTRPLVQRVVDTQAIVGGTTGSGIGLTQRNPIIFDKNFPVGDEAISELLIRYDGEQNYSAGNGTSVVTDGHLNFLRSLTVETDKHQKLVDGVDGLGLHRIQAFRKGTRPAHLAAADANDGTLFSSSLIIPFIDWYSEVRPFDTILDMIRSRMIVKTQFGIMTDVITGGTNAEVINLTENISAMVLPGPINRAPVSSGGEIPQFMPVLEMVRVDINQTGKTRIQLPYNDRILRRLYISQRSSSTLGELNNTVLTKTAEISLIINGYPYINRMRNIDLQDSNKSNFQLETMPNGWTVLEFDRTKKIMDYLSMIDDKSGNAYLEVDGTSVSNGQLWLYFDSLKLIPSAAQAA